ncbi:FUSC family protein [Castellaniella sp.]|uniref:FUSC family protein n=1 Tax=Castellaniella sp. TaxID=1955812 RepID=UPI00356082AD
MQRHDTLQRHSLPFILRRELAPFDGRLDTAWRVAATCALTVMLFMTYGIPLVAIGCYLVLFVMKPNQAETLLMAIGICLLVGLMVPVLLGITRLSLEYPVWRMAVLVICSVFFMFLQAASQVGPAGGIIALVIVFILTMLGEVPTGEIATRAILYAGLMAAVPMATLLAFNSIVGPSIPRRLRIALAERLGAVHEALLSDDPAAREAVREALDEGDEGTDKMLLFIRLFHLVARPEQVALRQAVESTRSLLLACAALAGHHQAAQADRRARLAAHSQALAHALRQASWHPSSSPPQTEGPPHAAGQPQTEDIPRTEGIPQAEDIPQPKGMPQTRSATRWDAPLDAIQGMLAQFPLPPPAMQIHSTLAQSGFFAADAWRNPHYQQYALKTTLAALLCYWIYTAIQWQDIHTALITCYVGALGTTAETLHKLTLRITGCLIGAAIGVASIWFLIPFMTSIGELMLLVFAVTLLAAWISTGSERSAYAGVQIGLAFMLTVLDGFGPSVEMSGALYRIMGILLGNVVLYLVFTRIWPISAAASARSHLSLLWDNLRQHERQPGAPEPAALRADAPNAMRLLAQTRAQLALIPFEPRTVRPPDEQVSALHDITEKLEHYYLRSAYPDTMIPSDQTSALAAELKAVLQDP